MLETVNIPSFIASKVAIQVENQGVKQMITAIDSYFVYTIAGWLVMMVWILFASDILQNGSKLSEGKVLVDIWLACMTWQTRLGDRIARQFNGLGQRRHQRDSIKLYR
jgi:hypothetical protein